MTKTIKIRQINVQTGEEIETEEIIEVNEEEITQQELQAKTQEAAQYLSTTDWINTYKLRHDLGLEIIPEDSSKWDIINKRAEYIEFLKSKGGN